MRIFAKCTLGILIVSVVILAIIVPFSGPFKPMVDFEYIGPSSTVRRGEQLPTRIVQMTNQGAQSVWYRGKTGNLEIFDFYKFYEDSPHRRGGMSVGGNNPWVRLAPATSCKIEVFALPGETGIEFSLKLRDWRWRTATVCSEKIVWPETERANTE